MRYMTDTRQCLPSKPITHDLLQILKLGNLRCRKPFTQNRQIVSLPVSTRAQQGEDYANAMSIVGDLQQFESPVFNDDVDLC